AAGIQVISGMARGIDSISQSACLDAGGKSFAVLGSGADICYPPEERPLYERLVQEGGIISEYPLGMQPLNKNFPPRNRLISGLADLVLVIEAREKSGTLITVDMALEQGREVAVVPGRITDALSLGCHKLYSQGAHLVISPQQMAQMVWEAFALRQKSGEYSPDRKTAAMAGSKTGRESGRDIAQDIGGIIAGNEDGYPGFLLPSEKEQNALCPEERKPTYDPSLSPFLNQLLVLLDKTPQSVEALYSIFTENDGHAELPQFLTGLLELELAGKCQNVGGQFIKI
ncbi:MAG: DNA-protecting protein DprA, partial [Lachnospiraceae bacterium]|nr:DNA-protecting protein DprA [Lachnospiraceae bacterium]